MHARELAALGLVETVPPQEPWQHYLQSVVLSHVLTPECILREDIDEQAVLLLEESRPHFGAPATHRQTAVINSYGVYLDDRTQTDAHRDTRDLLGRILLPAQAMDILVAAWLRYRPYPTTTDKQEEEQETMSQGSQFHLAYPNHREDPIEVIASEEFWAHDTEEFKNASGHASEYVQVTVPGDYESVDALYAWVAAENARRRGEEEES